MSSFSEFRATAKLLGSKEKNAVDNLRVSGGASCTFQLEEITYFMQA